MQEDQKVSDREHLSVRISTHPLDVTVRKSPQYTYNPLHKACILKVRIMSESIASKCSCQNALYVQSDPCQNALYVQSDPCQIPLYAHAPPPPSYWQVH